MESLQMFTFKYECDTRNTLLNQRKLKYSTDQNLHIQKLKTTKPLKGENKTFIYISLDRIKPSNRSRLKIYKCKKRLLDKAGQKSIPLSSQAVLVIKPNLSRFSIILEELIRRSSP